IKPCPLGGSEPSRRAAGSEGFMALPALTRAGCADGPVAHHTIEPGQRVLGQSSLRDQFQESILNDILWRSTPLARVQHQRRRVLVHQPPDDFWTHHDCDAGREVLSQESSARGKGFGMLILCPIFPVVPSYELARALRRSGRPRLLCRRNRCPA